MCWPKELSPWFCCKVDLGDGPSEQPLGTRTKEMYLPKKSDENQVSKFNGYTSFKASHPVVNSTNNGSNTEHGDPKNIILHEHSKLPGPNEGKLMPGTLGARGKNDFITPNNEKNDEDKFYGAKAIASAENLEVQSVGKAKREGTGDFHQNIKAESTSYPKRVDASRLLTEFPELSEGSCTEVTQEADEFLPKDKIKNADYHAADRRDQDTMEKTTPRS